MADNDVEKKKVVTGAEETKSFTEAPADIAAKALKRESVDPAVDLSTKDHSESREEASAGAAEELISADAEFTNENTKAAHAVPAQAPLAQWVSENLSFTPSPDSAELFSLADRHGISLRKSENGSVSIFDGRLSLASVPGTDEAAIAGSLREILSQPKYEDLPDNKFSKLAAQIEAEHGNSPIGGALVALLKLAAKYGNFMDSFSLTGFGADLEKDEFAEMTLSPEELAAMNSQQSEAEPFISPTYGKKEASTLYASSELFGNQYSNSNQKEFAAKLHNSPDFANKGANKNELLEKGLVPNTVVFFSIADKKSANKFNTGFNISETLTGFVNESGILVCYDKVKGKALPVDTNDQSFTLKAAFVPAGALPEASADVATPDLTVDAPVDVPAGAPPKVEVAAEVEVPVADPALS